MARYLVVNEKSGVDSEVSYAEFICCVFQNISTNTDLSYDSETTSLDPFHGSKIFAMTFCTGNNTYYVDPTKFHIWQLKLIFEKSNVTWFMANPTFDLHHLWKNYNIKVAGKVWDVLTGARLEYNDHMSYSLDSCARRVGLEKDNAVEKYIEEHKLWEWETIPGKKVRKKNKHYDQVPFEMMFEYACKDAEVTYELGQKLLKRHTQIDELMPEAPKLTDLMGMECQVTKAILDIEHHGVKVDEKYSKEAFDYYEEAQEIAKKEFKEITGKDFKASPKLYAEVFASEQSLWEFTDKGNPSFESDVIKKFKSQVAEKILTIRNAKSRCDFFAGFMHHSDSEGYIHPNFKQNGTSTGRFSSSNPNFQNLSNDEDGGEAYPTRSAIIPPDQDYCIVSLDYDQQEYRLLLDYSGEMDLIEEVKKGVDVHQATADLMGVTRKEAKTLNFMLLYGGGSQKLADALGISLAEAQKLKQLYFSKLPNVKAFIQKVIAVAEARGYVHNWAGRRYFCEREFSYRMPNRVIQGGGADIMKKAIIQVSELLSGKKSRIFLTVHDELDLYIHKTEIHLISQIKNIMENIYPSKHLKLTVSVSHSWGNLGALKDGPPDDTFKAKALEGAVQGIKNDLMTVEERLMKAFGLPRKTINEYCLFKIQGTDLFGQTHIGEVHKLAMLDSGVFMYNMRQYGLDDEARDKFS